MPALPGLDVHQVVRLLPVGLSEGIEFSDRQHEGGSQQKKQEQYMQEMKSGIKEKLGDRVTADEKDKPDPGSQRRHFFGNETDDTAGGDHHRKKSGHALNTHIESIFCN